MVSESCDSVGASMLSTFCYTNLLKSSNVDNCVLDPLFWERVKDAVDVVADLVAIVVGGLVV